MNTFQAARNCFRCVSGMHLVLLLAATWGCNSGPDTHPVQGKVVWKGGGDATELVGHTVTFESEDAKASGSGTVQADGTFTIGTFGEKDGALTGRHRIVVTPPELPEDTFPPPPLIPRRYGGFETSGLTADIKPETNPVVLEVERSGR